MGLAAGHVSRSCNSPERTGRQQSLDWTGLDSSGLEWKRSSATRTPNSVGLGWKMLSKNKYNFVALSLQLVREKWNTNCTWNSHLLTSHVNRKYVLDYSTGKDRQQFRQQSSIRLGWKRSSKNKCNFLVLSL